MCKAIFTTVFIQFFMLALSAQTEAERNAIKQFCGCYEVEFEYAETFAREEEYQLKKPYTAEALELLLLDEETPGKLVIQNILVMGDTFFIKHWRQDWRYQPTTSFVFTGKKQWATTQLDPAKVKGRWSQEIFEVDDTPRYAGVAAWHFDDGKASWSNTCDAPLPRREYTTREDYHILRRQNRLAFEEWGWMHEQDNQKIALDSTGGRHVIVEEKGHNAYRRTDPARCEAAKKWWEGQRWFWTQARTVWDEFLTTAGTSFTVQKMVGSDLLYDDMQRLSKQKYVDEKAARAAIQTVLAKYRSVAPAK